MSQKISNLEIDKATKTKAEYPSRGLPPSKKKITTLNSEFIGSNENIEEIDEYSSRDAGRLKVNP